MVDQSIQIQLTGFGDRLKQERERLGLSMHDFGLLGAVNRVTQMRYETGVNYPTVEYMHRLRQNGVDTLFIETGVQANDWLAMTDYDAFAQAIDLVDELMRLHGFKPPADFRVRSILSVYKRILRFGVKKVKPKLEDLINETQARQ